MKHKLVPTTLEDADTMLEWVINTENEDKKPIFFGLDGEENHQNHEIKGYEEGDGDSFEAHELEEVKKSHLDRNANKESFKNLLNMQTMKHFLGYLKGDTTKYLDSRLLHLNHTQPILQNLFNMIDSKAMKKIRHFILPNIYYNRKIYLDPSIFDSSKRIKIKKRSPFVIEPGNNEIEVDFKEVCPESLFHEDPYKIMVRFLYDKKMHKFSKVCDSIYSKYEKALKKKDIPTTQNQEKPEAPQNPSKSLSESVPPSSEPKPFEGPERKIKIKPETKTGEMAELAKSWISNSEKTNFETILIHFHGGAFVAMSSSSHQIYLRKWSKKLNIPIFSVDYRLAPQTKFPFLLNDCIRGYVWVLTFLEEVLGCNVKKVIVAGDSAGGNLCFGVTNWCIENGFRKPDLLHANYPNVSKDKTYMTPSLLYCIDDTLLHYQVMKDVIKMYLSEKVDLKNNHYVSPLTTPNSILEQFPPVQLLICERDPLRDHSFRLALKLK